MLDALLEESLGFCVVTCLSSCETGVVEGVSVNLVDRSGTYNCSGLLEKISSLCVLTEIVARISLIAEFFSNLGKSLNSGLFCLRIKGISLLISFSGLRKSVLDNRTGNLDHCDLATTVEVEILVGVNLLGHLLTGDSDGLGRCRVLITHDEFEVVLGSTLPDVASRSVVSGDVSLSESCPCGSLGSLLGIL